MILCADIGGTSVKLGLCDKNGTLHAAAEASVSFDHYQTPIIDTVIREAKAFLAAHPCALEGIGVSATGQVDSRLGAIVGTNGKIANYEGTNVKARMEEAFAVPCEVLNDANAALLGEVFCGGAQKERNVVMLTLGTGVGGGVLVDGRLLTGHGGLEKLEYRTDVPIPRPAADEVLIQVGAAGVNNTDINTRIGWYSKGVTAETGAGGAAGRLTGACRRLPASARAAP